MLVTRSTLHLDPQVHLPGRADPVGAGDRAAGSPRTPGCGSPSGAASGPDYARTLRALARTLPASAGTGCAALGFDETFRRMWEFYLAYCEAGFRVGYLDVHQLALQRR